MQGKYSKISEAAKDKILEYAQSEEDFLYLDGVLNKRRHRKNHLEAMLGLKCSIDDLVDEYESIISGDEVIFDLIIETTNESKHE